MTVEALRRAADAYARAHYGRSIVLLSKADRDRCHEIARLILVAAASDESQTTG